MLLEDKFLTDDKLVIKPGTFDENKDIQKWRDKHNQFTVPTDEPIGTYKLKTSVCCANCGKVETFETSGSLELEAICQRNGWQMAPDENNNWFPVCLECVLKNNKLM